MPLLDHPSQQDIVLAIGGAASLLGGVLMLMAHCCWATDTLVVTRRLVLSMCIIGVLSGLSFLLTSFNGVHHTRSSGLCTVQGMVIQYVLSANDAFVFCFSKILMAVTISPHRRDRLGRLMAACVVAVWLYPIIPTFVPIAFGARYTYQSDDETQWNYWCWFTSSKDGYTSMWLTQYGPRAFVVAYVLATNHAIRKAIYGGQLSGTTESSALRRSEALGSRAVDDNGNNGVIKEGARRSDEGDGRKLIMGSSSHANGDIAKQKERRQLMRRLAAFPLSYVAVWVPAYASLIVAQTGGPTIEPLNLIAFGLVTGQGFVWAMVYGINRPFRSKVQALMLRGFWWRRKRRELPGPNTSPRMPRR